MLNDLNEGMSINFDNGQALPSYSAILKDLVEAVATVEECEECAFSIEIKEGMAKLLLNEITMQIMCQEDAIKDYKIQRAKDTLKTDNITSITK